jgi:hypothetical protein
MIQFAAITLSGCGRIDDALAEIVSALQARGVRVSGMVRALPAGMQAHPCDMDMRVLPDGPLFRISQDLGQGAKGCRLDGRVIEAIAMEVEARLVGADLLVVNKFGKQDGLGRGLCPAIGSALDLGIPVLVGISVLNLPDFRLFAGGMAQEIEPSAAAVWSWLSRAGQTAPLRRA